MDTSRFDFELPNDFIALRPTSPRDAARLMTLGRTGGIEHRHMYDLSQLLRAGDVLVVNNSKVIAARLYGKRERIATPQYAQPNVELLLCARLDTDRFEALCKPARKLQVGDVLNLGRTLRATVTARGDAGEITVRFDRSGAALDGAIAQEGEMPLPPYIVKRRPVDARDGEDYQTIFARAEGSVAAPTAGLHFTPDLLAAIRARGIAVESVTLHVGPGTFLPMTAQDTSDHKMHSERAILTADTARRLNEARAKGGRIVAVGTTSLRTLESAARADGVIEAFDGETDIFITPGYRLRTAEVLLTNFHLPRSTLFMLVCAFCGIDRMQAAYAEAIARGYRFYSYGDACLLFRDGAVPA